MLNADLYCPSFESLIGHHLLSALTTMRSTAFFAAIAALLMATAAHAQMRSIPAEARRAELRHLQEMVVELNGTPVRLAAAAQIRDQSNRIVLPASLTETSLVRYLTDPQGQVTRIWILTPAEAAQPDPGR